MGIRDIFKRKKSEYSDPALENVVSFMRDKATTYADQKHTMNQKERIEFDLIHEILKVIKKSN